MSHQKFNQLDSEQEALQQMTAVRLVQQITSFAANTDITIKAPSSIINATNIGADIAYKLIDDSDAYLVEYFAAGQEKLKMVITGDSTGGIGSSGNGTTCTKVFVCES